MQRSSTSTVAMPGRPEGKYLDTSTPGRGQSGPNTPSSRRAAYQNSSGCGGVMGPGSEGSTRMLDPMTVPGAGQLMRVGSSAALQTHDSVMQAAFPPSSISPVHTHEHGNQMVLMEALASRDFQSMASAQTAHRIERCMLRCSMPAQKATPSRQDSAHTRPEISVTRAQSLQHEQGSICRFA